jgi:hypothetical protein
VLEDGALGASFGGCVCEQPAPSANSSALLQAKIRGFSKRRAERDEWTIMLLWRRKQAKVLARVSILTKRPGPSMIDRAGFPGEAFSPARRSPAQSGSIPQQPYLQHPPTLQVVTFELHLPPTPHTL